MYNQVEEWYSYMVDKCVDLGICYEDEAIAIKPFELSKNERGSLAIDLSFLASLSRKVICEYPQIIYPYLRNDHKALISAFKDKIKFPSIMRPDGIYVDGNLKIIDLNVDSAIGGIWEVDFLQSFIKRNPELNYTESSYITPKDALLKFLNKIADKLTFTTEGQLNLALVGLADQNQFYKDQANDICEWITKHTKFNAFYKIPETLEVKESMLADNIRSYHVLYRDSAFLHPENKTQPMYDLLQKLASVDIKTAVLSDPIDLGIEQKAMLAILSEALDGENIIKLSEAESFLISKYVPWTRILRDDQVKYKRKEVSLISLLHQSQTDFVVKRCCSHAGEHVFFGDSMSQNQWKDLLDQVIKQYEGKWIVQEALKSDTYDFVYYGSAEGAYHKRQSYTFSPFIFGDEFGGALIRIQKNNNQRVLALPTNSEIGSAGVIINDL